MTLQRCGASRANWSLQRRGGGVQNLPAPAAALGWGGAATRQVLNRRLWAPGTGGDAVQQVLGASTSLNLSQEV